MWRGRSPVTRFAAAACGALMAAGCGHATKPSSSGPAPAASTSTVQPLVAEGPVVQWDRPLPNAVDVTPGSESSSTAVQALSFALVHPRFPREPTLIRVSDPALMPAEGRAAALRYDFSGMAGYPVDGRVVVYEEVPHITQALLEQIALNPPGDPRDYAVVTVSHTRALLNQHAGIGRIRFLHGGVLFDITGPAVPPERVLELAGAILSG